MIIVEGEVGLRPDQRRLTCFGALEVTLAEGGPSFSKLSRSTSLDADRLDILDRMRGLASGRHVLVGSTHPYETILDHRHLLRDGLPLMDIVAVDGAAASSELTFLRVLERNFADVAPAFDLPYSGGSSILERARHAGLRAQLGWLAYVSIQLR